MRASTLHAATHNQRKQRPAAAAGSRSAALVGRRHRPGAQRHVDHILFPTADLATGSTPDDSLPAPPVVHTVSAEGQGSHRTISAAVGAAAPGDMVMVQPGRYLERVHVPSSVQLVAERRGTVYLGAPLDGPAASSGGGGGSGDQGLARQPPPHLVCRGLFGGGRSSRRRVGRRWCAAAAAAAAAAAVNCGAGTACTPA
eukprot:COSAG01_NODE_1494_length_10125_cov_93.590805_7_plen_199_part_00